MNLEPITDEYREMVRKLHEPFHPCPECGNDWGAIPIYELDGKPAVEITVTCRKCGYEEKVKDGGA